MTDVFKEVDEDLKKEEFAKWLKKYGIIVLVLSFLIVLATAVNVIYSNHKHKVNQAQTEILETIISMENAKDMIAKSEELDKEHKFLADFIIAGKQSEAGEYTEANKKYEEILNSSLSKEYKDLSRIYLVQNTLNMENGNLAKAEELIKPLLSKENTFYYLAAEQNALIQYKLNKKEEFKAILENLSNDINTPDLIRTQAEKMKTLHKE